MNTKNKINKGLVILFVAAFFFISFDVCHAAILGPDKDTLTSWLYNKKEVVGKRFGIFDRTEIVNIYNVKAIKIIDYHEEYSANPLTKNTGAVYFEFTYTLDGQDLGYLAMCAYKWEFGLTGKKRYLTSVTIKNK